MPIPQLPPIRLVDSLNATAEASRERRAGMVQAGLQAGTALATQGMANKGGRLRTAMEQEGANKRQAAGEKAAGKRTQMEQQGTTKRAATQEQGATQRTAMTIDAQKELQVQEAEAGLIRDELQQKWIGEWKDIERGWKLDDDVYKEALATKDITRIEKSEKETRAWQTRLTMHALDRQTDGFLALIKMSEAQLGADRSARVRDIEVERMAQSYDAIQKTNEARLTEAGAYLSDDPVLGNLPFAPVEALTPANLEKAFYTATAKMGSAVSLDSLSAAKRGDLEKELIDLAKKNDAGAIQKYFVTVNALDALEKQLAASEDQLAKGKLPTHKETALVGFGGKVEVSRPNTMESQRQYITDARQKIQDARRSLNQLKFSTAEVAPNLKLGPLVISWDDAYKGNSLKAAAWRAKQQFPDNAGEMLTKAAQDYLHGMIRPDNLLLSPELREADPQLFDELQQKQIAKYNLIAGQRGLPLYGPRLQTGLTENANAGQTGTVPPLGDIITRGLGGPLSPITPIGE